MILSAGVYYPCGMLPLVFIGENMKMCQEDRIAWVEKLDRAQALLLLMHDKFLYAFDGPEFRKVYDEIDHLSDRLKIEYFNIRKRERGV